MVWQSILSSLRTARFARAGVDLLCKTQRVACMAGSLRIYGSSVLPLILLTGIPETCALWWGTPAWGPHKDQRIHFCSPSMKRCFAGEGFRPSEIPDAAILVLAPNGQQLAHVRSEMLLCTQGIPCICTQWWGHA